MSATPRILALAGSTRKGSYNKRLVRIAARGAEAAGAEVTVVDLRDVHLPLFDEGLERDEGTPENARRLKALMVGHDGFLVSSPEYNCSFSGVLKNAIDWASCPARDEPPLFAFRGNLATIRRALAEDAREPAPAGSGPPTVSPGQRRRHRPARPGLHPQGIRGVRRGRDASRPEEAGGGRGAGGEAFAGFVAKLEA